MKKKIVLVLIITLIAVGSITVVQKDSFGLGDDQCSCDTAECENQMEQLCINAGYTFMGWSQVVSVCDEGVYPNCWTLFRVFCDTDGRPWGTSIECECNANCY